MGRAYQNRKDSMAKTADQKTKIYSKFSREIYMSAKSLGVDPNGNTQLGNLIERAKKSQVPSHVINKAIEKASGSDGKEYSVARYEGYAPGNTMVIIECLTDNPNRTFGEVRSCFTKTKTKIGTQGTVSHMFDHVSIFVFEGVDEDIVLDVLMEENIDVMDIEKEDNDITVFAPHNEFGKTRSALVAAFPKIKFKIEEIQFISKTVHPIQDEEKEMLETFLEMLDEVDDVQNIYHDAGI